MLKKLRGVVALVGLCALSLLLLSCGSSSSRPSGVLYVLTQGSNGVGNNVSSFAVDLGNGALSLVNSNASTCMPAGGTCGAPLDIVLDPSGATAFVLNQGIPCPEVEVFNQQLMVWQWVCVSSSNPPVPPTIYPYTVNSDGSLSTPGTPVTWTCANLNVTPCAYNDTPVAMGRDATGQFLFVIDQGSFPSPGTTTPPAYPTCPHVPTGPTDVCPSISVFAMKSTTLTLASGSPFYLSKIPSALSAIAFTAQDGTPEEFLFVTNNQDICMANCKPPSPHNDNTVSVYTVDSSSGALSEQAFSPYAIAAVNPISVIAVNTNPPGRPTAGGVFVYVGNNDSNGGDINPFVLCTVIGNNGCSQTDVQNNLMKPLGQTCPQPPCNNVPPSAAGQKPVGMVVDPTNNFLYVVSEDSSQVFGFTINTSAGTLTNQSPANLPSQGSQPVSIALHPSVNNTGQFLFVSNSNSDNVASFTLSTTTGSMSNPITVIAPAAPSGIAVH